MLKQNGTLSYIVSYTWRTIKSHRPLRKKILDNTTVAHILDLPPWIFDATVDTTIITLQKTPASQNHELIAGDLRGIEKDDWKSLSDNLIAVSGHGPDIQTLNCARYTYSQNLISIYDNLSFFIASPKLSELMNDTTCETIEQDDLHIRRMVFNEKVIPLVRFGDDYIKQGNAKIWQNLGIAKVISGIKTGNNKKYLYRRERVGKNLPLITNEHLATEAELNALTSDEKANGRNVGSFLVPFEMGLSSDTESGLLPNYYQPEINYYISWTSDSVEAMRNEAHSDLANPEFRFEHGVSFSFAGQYAPTFRESVGEVFQNASPRIFCERYNRNYIMGVLCSTLARFFMKNLINHSVNFGVDDLKDMPFPINLNEQIAALTEEIIRRQRDNPQYTYYLGEQKEIDALVYEVYGLSDEDIREVELWYCRRYTLLAEAQGFLAEVKEKNADHLARCQRILEKTPSYWRSNPILELIAQGESHTLEFKETLEYNIHTNERTPGLVKSSLKTIAAFLNTDGGTLLIGVSDSGEIKSIARDLQFVRGNNCDGFEQKLRSLINDHFDPSPLGNTEIRFEDLQEGTVCQINVEKSSEPVAYDNDFYIRDGNGTRKLEGRGLADWLRRRNNS